MVGSLLFSPPSGKGFTFSVRLLIISLQDFTLTELYFPGVFCKIRYQFLYFDKLKILHWAGLCPTSLLEVNLNNIFFFTTIGLGLINVISRLRKPELKILSACAARPHKIISLGENKIQILSVIINISLNKSTASLCQFPPKCPFWLLLAEGGFI